MGHPLDYTSPENATAEERVAAGLQAIRPATDADRQHAARMADAEDGGYDPDAIFAAEDEAPPGVDPHIDALRSQGLM